MVTRWLGQAWLLAVLLGLTILISAMLGVVSINPLAVFSNEVGAVGRDIILNIRLPRVLMAAITGYALAISGVAIQSVFRNPLAEPALIGVSAGAAFAAALALLIVPAGVIGITWYISGAAFLGGLLVSFLVYGFFTLLRSRAHSYLLLIGIAINALLAAALGLLNFVADAAQLKQMIFWSMGGFSAANWSSVLVFALGVLPLALCLPRFAEVMNAMLLGDRETGHLGYAPQKLSRRILLLVALAVGSSVAVAGIIGFIGLIVPHIGRRLVGSEHGLLLPVAGLLGAILLVVADLLARMLVAPAEIPVGVITALLGGPFFLYLLLAKRGAL